MYDPYYYHYDYYPLWRRIDHEMRRVNEREANFSLIKSQSAAELNTAYKVNICFKI